MRILSDMPDLTSAEIEGVELPNEVEFIRLDTERLVLYVVLSVANIHWLKIEHSQMPTLDHSQSD